MKYKREYSILVTGAAGLQGYHLVRDLVIQPEVVQVVGIDDFSRPFLEQPRKWARNLHKKFTLEERKYQSLTSSELAEFDTVIHLAASISVPESMSSDEMQRHYWKNNAEGMLELMIKLMHKDKWPVLIYASTSETFGNPIITPMPHDHLQNPQSIYAVSKLAAEKMVTAHAQWNKYPGVVVRTFNTYGPNQNSSFSDAAVIALFIKKALCGDTLTIHGDGSQTRDFQYVQDAIRAYRYLALRGQEEGTKHYAFTGRQYNTGTGVQTTIQDLADLIMSITNSTSNITHIDARTGDIIALEADYSRIRKDIGWKPQVDLREGLTKTIKWYREQYCKSGVLPIDDEEKKLERVITQG